VTECNEEPTKLNRDVALGALWPNSLFSKVVFSLNYCPKITQLFFLSKLIPSHDARKVIDISSVFRMKNLQDAGMDDVFFWINPVEKYTRSFLRCYVNRGNVTSWRILVTPLAAPSIMKQVPHSCATLVEAGSTFARPRMAPASLLITYRYQDHVRGLAVTSHDDVIDERPPYWRYF
jgi:hypothetical protein